jgi:intracellular septation protein A
MTDAGTPLDGLLARAGGLRGLIQTALPVAVFAATSAAAGLRPATAAAVGVAVVLLGWQLARREPVRPALLGFAGVAACAGLAFVTGQAKDFYLPGILMYLVLAVAFTASVLVRRPLVGVVWARMTGRDGSWRRNRRVSRAFVGVTLVMAVVSLTRFLVQGYLYDTDQEGPLAVARIAMGWPVFLLTSTLIYLAVRTANRALPRISVT